MKHMTLGPEGPTLAYADEGSGPALVLIHGNLGSKRWWQRSMTIPGWRVLAPDLPNCGDSSPIPDYQPIRADLFDYARILVDFLEKLGVEKPVLVGHSLGGNVVQAMVALEPRLARGIILVDPGSPTGLQTPEARFPAIEAMRANRDILRAGLKAVVPAMRDEDWFRDLVDDAARMAHAAWVGHAMALNRFDAGARLGACTSPAMVIRGALDVLITHDMAQACVAAFPRAMLRELPFVGHSVMVEDPGLWQDLLQDFLAGLD